MWDKIVKALAAAGGAILGWVGGWNVMLTVLAVAMAVKAFKVLGCNGVSRIDFMIDGETDKVYLNEINTIPGSLSFYLWEPIGVPYSKLLDKMIELALKRKREDDSIVFSFETNILSGNFSFGSSQKGGKLGSKLGSKN